MKIKNIILNLLIVVLSLSITACSSQPAEYEIEYNFSLNSVNVQLEKGDTFQLVAKYGDYDIVYDCEENNIISLSETGFITALNYGVAYIKITVDGVEGLERTCKVTVEDNTYEIKFIIENNYSVNINTQRRLEVKTYKNGEQYDCAVSWVMNNADAKLIADGNAAIFYSSIVGKYSITVNSIDGATATIEINVVDGFAD